MMKLPKFKTLKIIFAALAGLVLGINLITKYRVKNALAEYSAQFGQDGTPNSTEISMQRAYFGVDKRPRGVLLLHGIPSSTSTFSALCRSLEESDVPFLAPMLTGYGNTDINLLPYVSYEDWLRDALIGYDTLARCVDEVSIACTSTGALLATWISERRPVENLVMIVPNFEAGASAKNYKAILETPVASQLFKWVMPYKLSDSGATADKSRYRYPFHEVNSTRQMFLLQDLIAPAQIQVGHGVYMLYGSEDTTVSTDELDHLLEERQSSGEFEYESIEYNAPHAILQSDEADLVVAQIVEILTRTAALQ